MVVQGIGRDSKGLSSEVSRVIFGGRKRRWFIGQVQALVRVSGVCVHMSRVCAKLIERLMVGALVWECNGSLVYV